jgi:hypothetical protein
MCFKIIHHFVDIPHRDFFTLSNVKITQSNSFKLTVPNSRRDARTDFFQFELSIHRIRHLMKLLMPKVFHLLVVNFLQWYCHLLWTGKTVTISSFIRCISFRIVLLSSMFCYVPLCLEAIPSLLCVYNFIELCDASVASRAICCNIFYLLTYVFGQRKSNYKQRNKWRF